MYFAPFVVAVAVPLSLSFKRNGGRADEGTSGGPFALARDLPRDLSDDRGKHDDIFNLCKE